LIRKLLQQRAWTAAGLAPRRLVPLWLATCAVAVAAYQSLIFAVLDGVPLWRSGLSLPYFLLNVAVVMALTALAHALVGRWLLAQVLAHGIIAVFIFFHIGKMLAINRPLYLTDLASTWQVVSLLPALARSVSGLFAALGFAVLALGALAWLAIRHPVRRARAGERVLAGTLAALVLAPAVAWTRLVPRGSRVDTALRDQLWGGRDFFVQKGFVLACLLQLALATPSPQVYDEASVDAALRRSGLTSSPRPELPDPLPDIVLYLAEAVWDPTVLPVSFDRDPMPSLRRLLAGPVGGDVRVPVFGGLTPQTEFEVLTGLSTDFFPMGTVVFQRYLRQPLPSIAAYLASLGYTTTAVHTNHGWFWDRARALPLLGFERFVTLQDFDRCPMAGAFVSDLALVDKVVSECEASAPCFVFAISMASHGPYDRALPLDAPVRVTGGLAGASRVALEGYATALAHADLAVGRLVDRFASWPRPVVVAVFGDHLPLLGPDFAVYRETGFRHSPPSAEEHEHMHTTPAFIWSNRPLPPERLHGRASAFGARVLRAAGLPLPLPLAFAEHLEAVAPTPAAVPQSVRDDWWLLHHDLVFGSQFTAALDPLLTSWRQRALLAATGETVADTAARVEIEDFAPRSLQVGEEHLPQPDGSSAMWVKSRNASSRARIVLDGEPLTTFARPDGILTATIPTRVLRSPGRYSLHIADPLTRSRSAAVEMEIVDPTSANSRAGKARLMAWGPESVEEGVDFNLQPDGSSAFWFRLENPPGSVAVRLDGVEIPTATGEGGMVSATTAPLARGWHRLTLVEAATGRPVAEVRVDVRPRPATR